MVLAGRYFTSFGLVMALMLPGLSGQGSAGAQVRPAKAQATDLEKRLEAAEAVYQRSDFAEAEKLLLAAVAEAEKNGEERNLDLSLAALYQSKGKTAEARDLAAYSPTKVAWLLGVASGKVVTDVVTGDVPAEREGRGITPEAVIEELTGAGFELINRVENWEYQGDRYCLVFRRKPDQ